MKSIYVDHAAATPMDPSIVAIMQPYFADKFYNPSAIYLAAKSVKSDIEEARTNIAKILGTKPSEIIFTAGGTEANNLAIHGVMSQFSDANLIVSAIEHESVLEPARKYTHKELPVSESGVVQTEQLEKLIDDKTVLVSVMYANNEIGTIQQLNNASAIIADTRHKRVLAGNKLPLYLHTDACQAANYLNLSVKQKGIDLMTLNGGKIYGPKQSGVLYCRSGIELQPQILGGGQERGIRSGTENPAQIIGFAKALEVANKLREKEVERLSSLQEYAQDLLIQTIPDAFVNGTVQRLLGADSTPKNIQHAFASSHRLPNNLHITIPGQDNERLMMQLDEAGIICAVGSACSASSEEPSHVLKAIGLSDEQARSSLRFTMGRGTTKTDIKQTIEALAQLVA